MTQPRSAARGKAIHPTGALGHPRCSFAIFKAMFAQRAHWWGSAQTTGGGQRRLTMASPLEAAQADDPCVTCCPRPPQPIVQETAGRREPASVEQKTRTPTFLLCRVDNSANYRATASAIWRTPCRDDEKDYVYSSEVMLRRVTGRNHFGRQRDIFPREQSPQLTQCSRARRCPSICEQNPERIMETRKRYYGRFYEVQRLQQLQRHHVNMEYNGITCNGRSRKGTTRHTARG